jgi:hypothetical protein
MMRKIFSTALALIFVFGAAAQPMAALGPGKHRGMNRFFTMDGFLGQGFEGILDELGEKKLGDLSGAELEALREKAEKARLETFYVRGAGAASFMMPGMGQFAVEEPLAGTAFLIGHLALVGGSLVGAYFLLPADLRFDSTDYLNAPISSLRTKWTGHSLMEYLPAAGVMAGGALIDFGLRLFSSGDAAQSAQKKISAGSVDLEAQAGQGFMGFRMRF